MPYNYKQAHQHSSDHRKEVEASGRCGCFYCLAIFASSEIEEWVDSGGTALCPKCTIDAVIGDASGFPIEAAFLGEMYKFWFEK